jgi:sterol desaturase/sphingolipid hydroxylase (fatty acid hydroxylase superfamily)
MDELVANHETVIRLGSFLGVFAIMALWEILAPRRNLTQPKGYRWLNNIGLVVFNTALLRVVFPVAAVGVAEYAQLQQWGLFNRMDVDPFAALLVSVILLDMAIYLQHVMFHAVPLLWRLHRVHHADLDFDVTTGARFHPVEILLSMLIKFGVIVLLGPPLAAVVIFEVLLNAMAMFNHSNVRLPLVLDKLLRRLIVTPDMHRVHHSHLADETNSNFGFNLSVWDRLFGTYRAQPAAGHTGMVIGIDTFRDPGECVKLPGMLLMPFTGKIMDYAINRRQMRGNQGRDHDRQA